MGHDMAGRLWVGQAVRRRRGSRPGTGGRLMPDLTLSPTSTRRFSRVVTERVGIAPTEQGLCLRERARGVSVDTILSLTAARLRVE
jgi:acyl CoA:acetate/3-ketoacid CoA transferase beta subunit